MGEWAGAEPEDDWDTIGEKMESKIKATLRGWLDEDEEEKKKKGGKKKTAGKKKKK